MEIKIGENIKKLRKNKGVTQEQLADVLNVSAAAISKWETGDTYPDISLLFPLAHYFNISVDELMGYYSSLMEKKIKDVLDEYQGLYNNSKYLEASELIKKARKKYPNDYRIMIKYLFEITGGLADNKPDVLNQNAEEITKICEVILTGCQDEKLRLDAITMQAKVLHAGGRTKEALELLEQFPSFYHSSGQRIEQLYAKNTAEFYNQLVFNLYELTDFAANKLTKSIFYDKKLTNEQKKAKVIKIGRGLSEFYADDDFSVFILFASMFWGEARAKAVLMQYDKGFIIKSTEETYRYVRRLEEIIRNNLYLRDYLDQTNVISTEDSYFKNYLDYTNKYLPEEIKSADEYLEMLKQFK